MKKYQEFEKYLEDRWEPEGVLDDDMPDAFNDYLAELDVQEVMDSAEEWGSKMYDLGRLNGMDEVLEKMKPHIEELKVIRDKLPK